MSKSTSDHGTLAGALRQNAPVFGIFCCLPLPQVIELIAGAGFDFVIIDNEHTLINPETLENMLRAADASGIPALVRVPGSAAAEIARVLDAGAQGVVLPRVRSREQAAAAVRLCRYAPEGDRGLAAGRAASYGNTGLSTDLAALLARANQDVLVVPMIEDREGVDAIDEIASLPGVNLIIEGAADLSQSLGVPWQPRHPSVRAALEQAQAAAQARGVPYCAALRTPEDLAQWWQRGVRCFTLGDDRALFQRTLRADLAQARAQCAQ
jgi:2-keto-3-deoxy-L-rhamnonate aldolase RhmA